MIKTLPPLHDVAQMAGVDLPRYLGDVASGHPHKVSQRLDRKVEESKE
jgi:flotillin